MKISDNQFYYDFRQLEQWGAQLDSEKDTKNIEAVAKQMESLFLQTVLKSMREANKAFESDLLKSNDNEFYQEMLDNQWAMSLSQGKGIGLAEALIRQLTEMQGIIK